MPDQTPYAYLYKLSPHILSVDKFKEVASKKGWKSSAGPLLYAVEKDILSFDSFAALAELTNSQLSFGGGTILNWVYARDKPRFSFDIDSQLRQHGLTKQYIMENIVHPLNEQLRRLDRVHSVKFGQYEFEIGTVILDAEKDHFPNLLSLKRRVYSLTVGSEAHKYLSKESKSQGLRDDGLRLKRFFGGEIPRIEDVRIEIGIPPAAEEIFPVEEVEVRPLVYPEVSVNPVTATLTKKEYMMALKLFKLGKRFEPNEERYAIPEFVKSVCDLQACRDSCNEKDLSAYLQHICMARDYDYGTALDVARKRLTELAEDERAIDWFRTSGQTSFIAQSHNLKEFVDVTLSLLMKLPSRPSDR